MKPSAETDPHRPSPPGAAAWATDEELLSWRPPTRTSYRLGVLGRCVSGVGWVLEWLFGLVSLFIGLAVLAALPVLQLLSLGYLLEAGGRVARTGKLRDGFIGVRLAARLGGVVLGAWLLLLPVRFVADMARAAEIIDPGGRASHQWRNALFVLIGLTFVQIVSACSRGGKLRYFFWPFSVVWLIRRLWRGGYYTEARDAVWDVFMSLRLRYYFWLGFRGFVGAFAWLALPITLLAVGRAVPRRAAGRPRRRRPARVRLAVSAVPANGAGGRESSPGHLRPAGGARRLRPGAVGVYVVLPPDAAVRPAALPFEDRNYPTRGRLAAESCFHRVHFPDPSADGMGVGAGRAG